VHDSAATFVPAATFGQLTQAHFSTIEQHDAWATHANCEFFPDVWAGWMQPFYFTEH
jgi:hypothetical protein